MEKKSTFPKKSPTPDFGSFALEIWPKNTTNFRAFGGQEGESKSAQGSVTLRNSTDDRNNGGHTP